MKSARLLDWETKRVPYDQVGEWTRRGWRPMVTSTGPNGTFIVVGRPAVGTLGADDHPAQEPAREGGLVEG